MDPMIRIGLMTEEEKIVKHCAEYLNIEDPKSKKHYVSAMRRVAVILIEELIKPKPKKHSVAKAISSTPGVVTYARGHKHLYKGKNCAKMYNFIYLNIKAKIKGEQYFTFNDLYEQAVNKFPDKTVLFYNAKPFAMYFVRHGMSAGEVVHLLGLPDDSTPLAFELEEKDLYLSIIDETIDNMITVLKTK